MSIEKIYNIDVDIVDNLTYPVMDFVQGDSLNKIVITLTNAGQTIDNLDIYNYKIMIKRPDGVLVYKIPQVLNNKIEYSLGTYELEKSGICTASLEIYNGLYRITTRQFNFYISKSLTDIEEVESETRLHIQYDYNDLANKPEIPDIPYNNFDLINSSIQKTTQNVIFNEDGSVQKVQHKDLQNNIVREDCFTYEPNIITEVRTLLSTDKTLTFVYHLDNLITEVM